MAQTIITDERTGRSSFTTVKKMIIKTTAGRVVRISECGFTEDIEDV